MAKKKRRGYYRIFFANGTSEDVEVQGLPAARKAARALAKGSKSQACVYRATAPFELTRVACYGKRRAGHRKWPAHTG